MKTVYYVIGPMASGKTTSATKLAGLMKIPLFHADLVYTALHELIEDPTFSPEELIDPLRWGSPENYGLSSWLGCESMWQAKAPLYSDMLASAPDEFIIEGFTLSFQEERELVRRVIGEHKSYLLRLDLPYDRWIAQYAQRNAEYRPDEPEYDVLRSYFSSSPHDIVYTFRDPNMLPVHYAPYQKEGFTDRKIAALKIPVHQGDVVNDIGCNEGLIGKWCVDQGASVAHGYEYNWRFLDKARDIGIIPHLGNVEHDPLEVADITLCVSVFHYFENPQGFLRKARAATRRLFVLELPIYVDPYTGASMEGKVVKFEPTGSGNIDVFRYSAGFIETMLWRNFSKIEYVGRSVPPDNSVRYIYHCWV